MVQTLHCLLVLLLLATPVASFANTHAFHIRIEDNIELDVLLSDTFEQDATAIEANDDDVPAMLTRWQITDEYEFALGLKAGQAADIGWPTWGWFLMGAITLLPAALGLSSPLVMMLFGVPLSLTLLITTLIVAFAKDKPDPPDRLWADAAGNSIDFQAGFAEGYGTSVKNQRIMSTFTGIAFSVALLVLAATQVESYSDGQ